MVSILLYNYGGMLMYEVKVYIDIAMTILAFTELVKVILIIAEKCKKVLSHLSSKELD